MDSNATLPMWSQHLMEYRRARGWVEADLARELKKLRPDLPAVKSLAHMIRSDWETGKHKPGPRYRMLLSTALGVDEANLFSDGPLTSAEDDEASCPSPSVESPLPLALTQPLPSAPPPVGPVAPELVVYFLEQLPGHYRADMFLGPRHLIPTVATQAQLIDSLIRSADGPVRRGLLGAGVAYSALLGWLHQDAGDFAQSARWRDISLDMAHRSADPQLISYALTNKAMLAIDVSDGRAVVDYAEAALADEGRLCPKVRVLGLVHQAHGYAFLRERDRVDAALDRAAGLVPQVDDEHPWGNSCRRTREYIDVQRATAYGRLGAHREAVDLWDRILGSAPESARRDNGVFWTRQATALAALPEPERVVEIAAATTAVASDTGSARLRRELVALNGKASSWAKTPAGRELSEIIATIT
ncbi:hypothetical protein [Actinocorallia libanotica]|uniref:HTH cro/C1-type domain-containing protein n=1 Tax=Actinocorallia libanotica TaxID=46162 RepID=A0ABN1RZT0_9ACTN